jgi:hypothetical protein
LGWDNHPGHLPGYGPIPATQVRTQAQHGTWQLLLTDPHLHRIIDAGTRTTPPGPTYTPITPTSTPAPVDPGGSAGEAGPVVPVEVWPSEVAACHSYTPSPRVKALVVMRDVTCRFPGCRRPAEQCDLDHRHPFDPTQPAITQTVAENLQPLCRVHHRVKTLAGWTWTRDQATGVTTITTALGQTYRLAPPTPTSPPWDTDTW